MPLLRRLTGERLTGAVALIGENSDLVHQVRMLRPAGRDDIGDIPDVLVVQPGDDSLQPRPDLLRSCGVSHVPGSHGRGTSARSRSGRS
jgi:hypothetical protein